MSITKLHINSLQGAQLSKERIQAGEERTDVTQRLKTICKHLKLSRLFVPWQLESLNRLASLAAVIYGSINDVIYV